MSSCQNLDPWLGMGSWAGDGGSLADRPARGLLTPSAPIDVKSSSAFFSSASVSLRSSTAAIAPGRPRARRAPHSSPLSSPPRCARCLMGWSHPDTLGVLSRWNWRRRTARRCSATPTRRPRRLPGRDGEGQGERTYRGDLIGSIDRKRPNVFIINGKRRGPCLPELSRPISASRDCGIRHRWIGSVWCPFNCSKSDQ